MVKLNEKIKYYSTVVFTTDVSSVCFEEGIYYKTVDIYTHQFCKTVTDIECEKS